MEINEPIIKAKYVLISIRMVNALTSLYESNEKKTKLT